MCDRIQIKVVVEIYGYRKSGTLLKVHGSIRDLFLEGKRHLGHLVNRKGILVLDKIHGLKVTHNTSNCPHDQHKTCQN